MNYIKLGTLPTETTDRLKQEVLRLKEPDNPFQWVFFDNQLTEYFDSIFVNTELKIQWNPVTNKRVQKVFYVEPGYGFRIHKDGLQCKSCINVAISCNDSDWVRWYDEDHINEIGKVDHQTWATGTSRNVDIYDFADVEYVEERRTKVGDVYLVNTDVYHSYMCNGPEPRMIMQTKFEGFPGVDTIYKSLYNASFKDLTPSTD